MKKPKINKREKKFLVLCGVFASLFLLWIFPINYFIKWRGSVSENLLERRTYRNKMKKKTDNKSTVEKEVKELKAVLAGINKHLLSGDKSPEIAAADLRGILKDMINRLGIELKREQENKEKPKILDKFTLITVEVVIKSNITKLKDLLFEIENSQTSLSITDMMIRVTNTSNPTDVEAQLTIVGLTSGKEEGIYTTPG
ncbi:MAG: GspMb/PilO family protein [bacterium]